MSGSKRQRKRAGGGRSAEFRAGQEGLGPEAVARIWRELQPREPKPAKGKGR